MNAYDIGDLIRLGVTFTNSAGVGVDPSSVSLQYRRWYADPSSYATVVYGVGSITRVTTGQFYHDATLTEAGEWRYRWNGQGANPAAVEGALMMTVRWVG